MKWFSVKQLLLLGAMLLMISSAGAKDVPPRPNPPRLVNDYIGLLTPEQQDALERKLVAFDDSTSTQIAIVIENSLEGDDIERYAHELAETWGIGRKGKNNGVLIYVAKNDRQMSIEVGYGLEPIITDVAAFRVRTEILTPYFKDGQFYEGLDSATTVLMKLATQEFTADQWAKEKPDTSGKKGLNPIAIIIVIIIVIIILSIAGRGGKGGGGRRRRSWLGQGMPPFWIGGGGWGRGGFGGGSGGGGGGGFGGFGGGSFGGGGSSGSW